MIRPHGKVTLCTCVFEVQNKRWCCSKDHRLRGKCHGWQIADIQLAGATERTGVTGGTGINRRQWCVFQRTCAFWSNDYSCSSLGANTPSALGARCRCRGAGRSPREPSSFWLDDGIQSKHSIAINRNIYGDSVWYGPNMSITAPPISLWD